MINIDLTRIKEDFTKVIQDSQNITDPKLDYYFDTWQKNKEYFYNAFGKKLIYEIPETIDFTLTDKMKSLRKEDFIGNFYQKFYYQNNSILGIETHKLYNFIKEITIEEFYQNRLNRNYNQYSEEIVSNMKVIKSFKFFIKDKELLHRVQDLASQYIQEEKISGRLCFSIHPLDFLSLSENTHSWRSCHALDGEYRAGNLSYMLDKTTFIAYLKTNDNVKLPNFPSDVPWNSKKWRMLMYVSNDNNMMFAGRQYPFESENARNIVMNYLPDGLKHNPNGSLNNIEWTPWSDYRVSYMEDPTIHEIYNYEHGYIPLGKSLKRLNYLVKDAEGATHYNDLLYSSYYKPFYTQRKSINPYYATILTNKDTKFEIGGRCICLQCGEELIENGSDSMLCHNCLEDRPMVYCVDCGRALQEDFDEYAVTYYGDIYCFDCFESRGGTYCSDCGCAIIGEEIREDEEHGIYYCPNCAQYHKNIT
jgi:hypothetical protein